MFMPLNLVHNKKYNCIIYAHGNSGNRCSIFECLNFILKKGFIAVSFDFSGYLIYYILRCGLSDGEYVTLG